ncbi:MAG TPA: YajQ family cyclic di-GMP-binding protein [Polyangiaceae bacterium]|nr:YajQ family cyclic di-GMP-binding protein [Polyangiaceae bacterium]
MPSFDVVSKVDWAEVTNALGQAQREVGQRFDFKGTETELERNDQGIVIRANSEERAKAALTVLQEKLVRRKVSLKHLDVGKPEKGPKGSSRILVKVKEGIETEKAKQIINLLKGSKIKAQASIHEQSVRISGKKKDDLQEVIALLKSTTDLELDLQFTNFRD